MRNSEYSRSHEVREDPQTWRASARIQDTETFASESSGYNSDVGVHAGKPGLEPVFCPRGLHRDWLVQDRTTGSYLDPSSFLGNTCIGGGDP
jgi:hypothetical protein